MYKVICLVLVCIGLSYCKAKKLPMDNSSSIEYDFPLDWIGHYEGELLIYNQQQDTTSVIMQLDISYPDNTGYYPWTIRYGENDLRAYGLEAINPQIGHYRIDEFNSIKLDGFYNAGHFTSRFEVLGSDILVDYQRIKGGIEVLFYISRAMPMEISGGAVFGTDTIPEVNSYNIVAFQKAFLKKSED